MRKFILLPAAFLFFNQAVSQNVSFGPRAGINISNVTGIIQSKSKPGLIAGGFFVFSFREHFGISTDLLYSSEGAKFKTISEAPGIITTTDYEWRLYYARIPFQANIFFNKLTNKFRPKLSLGVVPGYLISAKQTAEGVTVQNGIETFSSSATTESDDFNRLDFGAVIGGGINYRLGEKLWINFDARFIAGFTGLRKDIPDDENDPVTNKTFSASLGLAFGI